MLYPDFGGGGGGGGCALYISQQMYPWLSKYHTMNRI